ncbi:hypothetical protein E2C01_020533 [Portunus trituberculatus]|uniref:Uncharacterized protein n=1 Tax=Portunus trituberculatus TaxID=210409 RepID=A0A5B7E3M8_PORTR|nr:hypothetical protein [Portunus trituberculatus]
MSTSSATPSNTMTAGYNSPSGGENSACRSKIRTRYSACSSEIFQWNSAFTCDTFATKPREQEN